jgi:putative tributyrin esterase
MMNGLNFEYTYQEGPGGHDWDFWDAWIIRVLEWLPLEKAVD